MKSWTIAVALLAVSLTGCSSSKSDEAGVRAGVREFLRATALQDEAALQRVMYSETKQQAELMDEMAVMLVADFQLGEAIFERFGEAGLSEYAPGRKPNPFKSKKFPAEKNDLAIDLAASEAMFTIRGDRATVMFPDRPNQTAVFRRTKAGWKLEIITLMSDVPPDLKPFSERARRETAVYRRTQTEVQAGKFGTVAEIKAAVRNRLKGLPDPEPKVAGKSATPQTRKAFDPPKDSPTAAVKAYYDACVAGDVDGMRARLHVENALEEKHIQAILDRVAAERALEKAAAERFGPEQAKQLRRPLDDDLLDAFIRSSEQVKGDKALVTMGRATPLAMIRIDGVWKIAIGRHSLDLGLTTAEEIARERRIQRAVEETIENVKAGHYSAIVAASTALDNRMFEAWGEGKKSSGR